METNLKKLIGHVTPKSTREIVEDHVVEVGLDDSTNEITLVVDRRYAFNNLNSREHIGNLIKGVKNAFGEDKNTILKLQILSKNEEFEHHDREMNVPHTIHYR